MITRRDFVKTLPAATPAARLPGDEWKPSWEWIRSCRAIIAEAYNPPFYPSFDYRAERAVAIAKSLGADSLRYPAASYYAYFPTATRYPLHPELGSSDPFKETIDRCHKAGLIVIAYMPLNHPFMEVRAGNPLYQEWVKRFADGQPMTGSAPAAVRATPTFTWDGVDTTRADMLLLYIIDFNSTHTTRCCN